MKTQFVNTFIRSYPFVKSGSSVSSTIRAVEVKQKSLFLEYTVFMFFKKRIGLFWAFEMDSQRKNERKPPVDMTYPSISK